MITKVKSPINITGNQIKLHFDKTLFEAHWFLHSYPRRHLQRHQFHWVGRPIDQTNGPEMGMCSIRVLVPPLRYSHCLPEKATRRSIQPLLQLSTAPLRRCEARGFTSLHGSSRIVCFSKKLEGGASCRLEFKRCYARGGPRMSSNGSDSSSVPLAVVSFFVYWDGFLLFGMILLSGVICWACSLCVWENGSELSDDERWVLVIFNGYDEVVGGLGNYVEGSSYQLNWMQNWCIMRGSTYFWYQHISRERNMYVLESSYNWAAVNCSLLFP